MRLVFVRHGETQANVEGRIQGQAEPPAFPLTTQGRAQAEKLRDSFLENGFEPTHMYASPLQRTLETSEILSAPWPVLVTPWDDLKECGFGELTGLTWAEALERFPALDSEPKLDLIDGAHGVEPQADRRARAARVVETALAGHPNDSTLLMVTHGGILQNIVATALGSPRNWTISTANTGVFDFTIDADRWHEDGAVRYDSTLWRINRFNDASHLA